MSGREAGAGQVGNVVRIIRKPKRSAREIAASNAAARAVIEQHISDTLAQMNRDMDARVARCREEASDLARAMPVQDLYDWLKIGRELAGRTSGRGGPL